MRKILLLLCTVFCLYGLQGQNSAPAKPARKNPMIMVTPFAKEGEDLRKVLEAEIARRVALIKVKEAFDNRGYSTVDFLGKLKATQVDAAFTGGTQTDLKRQIIEASGADIYVDVEVFPLLSSTGNSVRLNITAYDAFTGTSLSNKTGSSPKIYTEDFSKLVERALVYQDNATEPVMLEAFLNTMQEKFDDIVENGRMIKVQFVIDGNSNVTFDDEIGTDGNPLSDVLEEWISKNAFKGGYSDPRITSSLVQFDEVRIPLYDEETKRNFTPSKFAIQILQSCNKLVPKGEKTTLKVKRDIRGGTIYITFQ